MSELEVLRRKIEMIEAIAWATKGARDSSSLLAGVRTVLNSSLADFDQPCEDCRGPLITGNKVHCEWCNARLPKPADQRPERHEARPGGDWCKRRDF